LGGEGLLNRIKPINYLEAKWFKRPERSEKTLDICVKTSR